MKSQSNLMQPAIWVRELENGIRHITLRRDFIEKQINNIDGMNGDITETQYEYDETNIYIVDRENIEDYVNINFGVLFEQGLLDENKPIEPTDKEKIDNLETLILQLSEVI